MQALYRHYDKDGTLLYVGISSNALRRLAEHRDNSAWFCDIHSVTIEHYETRQEVLEAEAKAIHLENPLHNVQRPNYCAKVELPDRHLVTLSREPFERYIETWAPKHAALLYTKSEAADSLMVSTGAIDRLISEGALECVDMNDGRNQSKKGKRIPIWSLVDYISGLKKLEKGTH